MPTVLRIGPYRFFFYSSDRYEPHHVHIERDASVAKFWLDPVRLGNSGGFNRKEISELQQMVTKHRVDLMEAWNEFFSS